MYDELSSRKLSAEDSTYAPIEEGREEETSADDDSTNEVDSADFSFNVANAYKTDSQAHHSKSSFPSSSSLSGGTIDGSSTNVPLIDLPEVLLTGLQLFNVGEAYKKTLHVLFTQILVYKGIKMVGEKAIAAMFKELKHLNNGVVPGKPAIEPILFNELLSKEREEALEAVNLIAQKQCGKIKERTCANGSKQKKYIKEDKSYSSPTTSLEAIIKTLMIDAYEGRDVAVADVSGAYYLHAENYILQCNFKVPSNQNWALLPTNSMLNPTRRVFIFFLFCSL